jgi:thiol-disulfide isomerase/thioredoxin
MHWRDMRHVRWLTAFEQAFESRVLPIAIGLCALAPLPGQANPTGTWRAWLDCPGGELPFELELAVPAKQGRATATIVNGLERIAVPKVGFEDRSLTLEIDYYDSVIRARLNAAGDRLDGTWEKALSKGRKRRMQFHASKGAVRFPRPVNVGLKPRPKTASFGGRWAVQFEKDKQGAVGVFEDLGGHKVTGTFLTTLGDYRYLAGVRYGQTMQLSCFDGAHAFLFTAKLSDPDKLRGDFWSSDSWHETFSGRRDPHAKLPDAWKLTAADVTKLGGLRFPDLAGDLRGLDDRHVRGKARVIVVFGSWCPNCKDETAYLVELDRRYRSRGLVVLGLAFEHSGDLAQDTRQLKRYAKRNGIKYPLLVAGLSDKAKASQALPILDRVRSYPTTLFLDKKGQVKAVHTGFSGPATGADHKKLRARFESLIESMLTGGKG